MSRQLRIAAIQMDAHPAPTAERLQRADHLVQQAAKAGAQLVVLPELFNAGYIYDDSNHRRAEPLDGPTVSWLRSTATRANIYLAGSLMLLDQDEVYNALLLVAPDGRLWRYNNIYPWGWERGYFRNGRDITVADTELGRIGMMVCWDSAHPELWRRYAGQVDFMLISSCPPQASNPTFHFPNGEHLPLAEVSPLLGTVKGTDQAVFGEMINEQTAWLGVPAVNTVGTGNVRTRIPNARGSILAMSLLAPRLLAYLPQADQAEITCAMTPGCKVVDGSGRILAQLSQAQGESFVVADVTLPDNRPQPQGRQPSTRVPSLGYFISDYVLPLLTIPVYRQGLRRAWGERMAPVEASTRVWTAVVAACTIVGLLLGTLIGRSSARRHQK